MEMIYGKNSIEIYEDHAKVVIIHKNEVYRAIIDLYNIDKIKDHKWHICKGYARTKINGKVVRMHRLISDIAEDIDHKDENKLNNMDDNLRPCTIVQNLANRKNIKGIYFHSRTNNWRAYIGVKGRKIYLGYFDTEDEARKARRGAEIQYFGEFIPNKSSNILNEKGSDYNYSDYNNV